MEYASVNELLIIVESVTCSILATVILVPVFTGTHRSLDYILLHG